MPHKLTALLLICLVALPLMPGAQAQDAPVELVLFVDRDALTLYLPAQGAVSLMGLRFEVTGINGQRRAYTLEEYPAFIGIRFDQILTPVCFQLKRYDSTVPMPLDCRNHVPPESWLIEAVSDADVFWYEQASNTARLVLLLSDQTVTGQCPAHAQRCSLTFTAPSPTPTLTLTPSLTPTLILAGFEVSWAPIINTEDFPVPMVYVPAGCFMMGSDSEDAYDDEQPAHEVCLSAFWIGLTEVTNAQYGECVAAGACEPPPSGDWCPDWQDPGLADHPVVCVNWYRSQAYAEWAGGTLPTEAQWEYAARGPAAYVFPWGDAFDDTKLNYCDANCSQDWSDPAWDDGYAGIAPVGSYPGGASWVGALDMAGNVYEWAADWYGSDYYGTLAPGVLDPSGPENGDYRVLRGGSFNGSLRNARAAIRFRYSPNDRLNFGIRACAPISLK